MTLSLTLGLIFASLQITPVYILLLKVLKSVQLISRAILIRSQIGPINGMSTLTPSNLNFFLYHAKLPHPSLYMNDVQVSPVSDHTHLGLLLSGNGTWQSNIEYMEAKASKRINIMRKLNFGVCRHRLGQL